MAISPEEMIAGQKAFLRVKKYELGARGRSWAWFGLIFWTFQSWLMFLIHFHRSHSYWELFWLLVPLGMTVFFFMCFGRAIDLNSRNGRDVDLLGELNRKFGPNINFETTEEPIEIDAAKKRKRLRDRTLLNVLAASVAISILFYMVFRILVYHIWPQPDHVLW